MRRVRMFCLGSKHVSKKNCSAHVIRSLHRRLRHAFLRQFTRNIKMIVDSFLT